PNSPVSTGIFPPDFSLRSATNLSYSGIATFGGAASIKLGRRPLLTSPYNVNCDTTSTPPCASVRSRFILPSASPKTRRPRIFSAIQTSLASVSVGAKPASTRKPGPMLPVTRLSTRTTAARLHFLDVADDLLVHAILRRDEHDRHQIIDERDRAVLHLGCRIPLGVDIGDFLELERAFERHRKVVTAAQIQHVLRANQ